MAATGWGALVLCAGDSVRMGHDKALLPYGEQRVVDAVCARAFEAGARRVLVCTSARIAALLEEGRVEAEGPVQMVVVDEEQRARGPIASIRAGLSFVADAGPGDRELEAWLLWPVDHPFVRAETLRALAHGLGEHDVAIPVSQDRGGHPILVAARAIPALLAASAEPERTLRDFVRAADRGRVPVEDEAIHWNCDSPERFRAGYARFAEHPAANTPALGRDSSTLGDEAIAPRSDRELAHSKVVRASPERVFDAFQDPGKLAQWWGPKGFRNTFHIFEFRPGGAWKLTMHGPDGKDYENESSFVEIEHARRIVIDHRSSPRYVAEFTFTAVDGGTRVCFYHRFESAEQCARIAKFAGPANEELMERLAELLGEAPDGKAHG